jgi:polar amino acid transport system permease protein
MGEWLSELGAGLVATMLLTLCAAFVSAAGGILVVAARLSGHHLLGVPARIYVSFMRGTPMLVQLFLVYFSLPALGLGGHPFAAASIAIGLNSAAYVAEILRGAILALSHGQREAAEAMGLPPARIWRRVVLPQALIAALPALTNEATLLLKTTPLASAVAVTELTFSGQMIIARTFQAGRVLALVSLGYLVLSFVITRASALLEHRLALKGGA